MDWTTILYLAGAALVVGLIYRSIKGNPEAFSRQNFAKSAQTLGILALLLIAFVAFLVFSLR